MGSFVPTTRRINWLYASFGIALFLILMLGFEQALPKLGSAPVWGAGGYLFLTIVLRRTLAKDHVRSVRLMRSQSWEDALHACERSFKFFEKYPALDKHRYIFLLSPSAMSYREMALTNSGFCLNQLGRHEEARRTYERVLNLFPDASIAPFALKAMGPGEEMPPSPQ